MKYIFIKIRYLLLFLLLPLALSAQIPQIPSWGVADTLEDYIIGPGIRYTKISYPDRPMLMWFYTVDLSNQYAKIEQVQSNERVPDVLRENVSEMSKRKSYPGHKVCAAFNHDFFSYEEGICIGLNISEGEITQRHSDGRSTLALTADKTAVVFHPVLKSEVILPDGSKVKIDNYNWWAKSHYGDCVLFNRFNSLKLADEGTYVRFKANGPWVVNGAPISCTVLDVGEEPQQTSDKEYVLFVRNAKRSLFDGLMKGDEIKISQNFEQGKFGKAPQDIVTAFHGYPSIAFEGKLHEGEYNDFENGREYELSSRLMGGVSKDGKTLYLAATELSSKSAGVNCIELANFMLAKGAWNVVNFDSGGSVAVVMDHTMQNEPGRGSIRPVEDGILFVSQAPESEVITKYQFTRKNLCIPSASLIDLHLIGYNKYMDIIERECTSFRFRCEPESLGWVDDNNFFHAIARKMSGKIIAEKDGISTELSVSLQEVEDVHLVTDKILLDDTHPYQIKIKATSMGNRFDLDPTAFIWTNSNPDVCKVEHGVISGLKNGNASLTGRLENIELLLDVVIEIGTDKMSQESFMDMASFSVNASSAFTDLRFSKEELPLEWEGGVNMQFNQKAGRSPQLEFQKMIPIYGIPDSLMMDIVLSEDMVNSVIYTFSNRNKPTFLVSDFKLKKGHNRIVIPFRKEEFLFNQEDFPLQLEKIKYTFISGNRPDVSIQMGPLNAVFPKQTADGISAVDSGKDILSVVLQNNVLYLKCEIENRSEISAVFWNAAGQQIYQRLFGKCESGAHSFQLASPFTIPGIYFAEIRIGSNRYFYKLIY